MPRELLPGRALFTKPSSLQESALWVFLSLKLFPCVRLTWNAVLFWLGKEEVTKLEEKKLYENEHETARGEALERARQEEEKLEEKQQTETLLQQIKELKLQETKVIFTFSSFEKGIRCLTWKYSKADLTSSLRVCTVGRVFPACRGAEQGTNSGQTSSLGWWSSLIYSLLVLVFSFLGNKAEKGTREFIKAAVGAGELGRRKETNGRAPEEERARVGHQVELVLDRICSCAHSSIWGTRIYSR